MMSSISRWNRSGGGLDEGMRYQAGGKTDYTMTKPTEPLLIAAKSRPRPTLSCADLRSRSPATVAPPPSDHYLLTARPCLRAARRRAALAGRARLEPKHPDRSCWQCAPP